MRTVICHHCDLVSNIPLIKKGFAVKCPRCSQILYKGASCTHSKLLALCLCSLFIMIPAYTLPLFDFTILQISEGIDLFTGALMLFKDAPLVSITVLFCAVIAPSLLTLNIFFFSLLSILKIQPKFFSFLIRFIRTLSHWSMLEVYLISLFVAYIKLMNDGYIYIDLGFFFFTALVFFNILVYINFDKLEHWDFVSNDAIAGRSGLSQDLQLCKLCGNYTKIDPLTNRCPTCNTRTYPRKKNSLQKSVALLLTAFIFIFPANLYPISYLLKNNTLFPDTIFSGIISLINSDNLGIAIIIFFASIVIPIFKILTLLFISLSVHKRWNLSPKKQQFAFILVEWIGKWSILDLFVMSIMVNVFDYEGLLSLSPGIAASAFTLVVVLTILSTHCFDTRLIWDANNYE